MEAVLVTLLNGISYGMVLFLIAAGLSLVLGFMGILNLAHGAIFMVGGYVGIAVAQATGNFIYGVLAGILASGLLGLLIERATLRYLHKQVLEQVLVTFGFVYIIANATLWVWGAWPKPAFIPYILAGSASIGVFQFPVHRFAIIVIGAAICFGLWWLQEKTRLGAIIRAGMDDAQMTSGIGINLTPITIGAFGFGSALAGLAAVVGTLFLGFMDPGIGTRLLFVALAVVVVGGVGSVQGALAGALLIGTINTLATTYFSELGLFTMYILMVLILLLRPSGLLGRRVY